MRFYDIQRFKNKHKGKTFVLFGSGPTLLDWKNSYCEDAINIGCNTVFMHKPDLDYYFIQDSGAVTKSPNCYLKSREEYDHYRPKIEKFYGLSLRESRVNISQKTKNYFNIFSVLGSKNVKYLDHSMRYEWAREGGAKIYSVVRDEHYLHNICSHPFYELNSVIFSCAQFALLAGAKRIIFVGCDITNNIRIGEDTKHSFYEDLRLLERWEMFINSVDIMNKQCALRVSLEGFNPIGLRGLLPEFSP